MGPQSRTRQRSVESGSSRRERTTIKTGTGIGVVSYVKPKVRARNSHWGSGRHPRTSSRFDPHDPASCPDYGTPTNNTTRPPQASLQVPPTIWVKKERQKGGGGDDHLRGTEGPSTRPFVGRTYQVTTATAVRMHLPVNVSQRSRLRKVLCGGRLWGARRKGGLGEGNVLRQSLFFSCFSDWHGRRLVRGERCPRVVLGKQTLPCPDPRSLVLSVTPG